MIVGVERTNGKATCVLGFDHDPDGGRWWTFQSRLPVRRALYEVDGRLSRGGLESAARGAEKYGVRLTPKGRRAPKGAR